MYYAALFYDYDMIDEYAGFYSYLSTEGKEHWGPTIPLVRQLGTAHHQRRQGGPGYRTILGFDPKGRACGTLPPAPAARGSSA